MLIERSPKENLIVPLTSDGCKIYYLNFDSGEIRNMTDTENDFSTGVNLSPIEAIIMLYLVKNDGEPNMIGKINREVWVANGLKCTNDCARVYVSRLRYKLRNVSPSLSGSLRTYPGQGYAWEAQSPFLDVSR